VSQFIIWAARQSFIDKNRAAMVDFMEDMLTIERWFMDPKNHKEVTEIAGKMMKAPPERFDWLFTKQDYYRNPDMLPDLKALQANIDLTHQLVSSKPAGRDEIHRPHPGPGRRQTLEVSVTPPQRMAKSKPGDPIAGALRCQSFVAMSRIIHARLLILLTLPPDVTNSTAPAFAEIPEVAST